LKKEFILILFCVLFAGSGLPPGIKNDLEKQRLKGSVKSVMETKYTLAGKDKNAQKDKIIFQKFTSYDIYGYETENRLYHDGTEYLVTSYISGPDGKPAEKKEYKADGTLNVTATFLYNEKGNLTEADYVWENDRQIGEICQNTDYYYEVIQNDIFTKVLYQYEYRGYCTEEQYFKSDGALSFKFINKYDPRGNQLEAAYYHSNERLSWMTKYTYDRYDNLIESRVFKSNRIVVLSTYKHQFDEIGNWTVRREERQVDINILTSGLEQNNMIIERTIEYY
jgi:hypothetical protein